jgi:hypothetical protein
MENYLKNNKSYIYSALLNNGYSNFSFTILEYCSPEQCIEREDYYLSTEKHEYNILEKAGSSIGRKHSDKTKTKISDALKGRNRPKGAGIPSQQIEVTDIINNTTNSYDSIREAARALNINNATIVKYFANNQQKPYKGQYTFKKL